MSFAQKIKAVLAIIRLLLEWLEHKTPEPATRLDLIPGPVTEQDAIPLGAPSMEAISNTQELDYTLSPKNRLGGAAAVDGVPTWVLDDPSIVSMDVATDGLSAHVKALGPLGTANITVDADADLGAGVTDIQGVATVVVSAAPASVVELNASAPTEQP